MANCLYVLLMEEGGGSRRVGRNVEYVLKTQLVMGTVSLPCMFHCPKDVIAMSKANVLKMHTLPTPVGDTSKSHGKRHE